MTMLPADYAYRVVRVGDNNVTYRLQWGELPEQPPLRRKTVRPHVQVTFLATGQQSTFYPVASSPDNLECSYRLSFPRAGRYEVRFCWEGWSSTTVWVDAEAGGAEWTEQVCLGSVLDRIIMAGDEGTAPVGSGGGGGLSTSQVQAIVNQAIAALDLDSYATDAEVLAAIQAVQGAMEALATEEWVGEQIAAAVAAAELDTLTEEQIAAIAAQVGDLSQYSTTDEMKAAIAAAVKTLGDEVSVALGQVIDDQSTQINALAESVGGEFEQVAYLNRPTQTIIADEVQAKAFATTSADGTRGHVIRGYSPEDAEGTGGVYLWNGDGTMVGRLALASEIGGEVLGGLTIHDDETPPSPATFPPTPKQMIAMWNAVGTGLHLYTKNNVAWLVSVATGPDQASVVVLSAGAITEAVFRSTAAESLLVQHNDGVKTVVMTAPNGDTAFKVKHDLDLTKFATTDQVGATIGQVIAQGLTTEQVYQIISALPNTPVTAADLTALQEQVTQLDELYTNMLGSVAGWTQAVAGKADLTNPEQVMTAKSLRADALAFRDLDFVLALIDSPDYGERVALLRKDDGPDPNDANFVVLRTDLADLAEQIGGMSRTVEEVRAASEAAGQIEAAETVQAVTVVREFLTPGPWVDLPLVDGAQVNEAMKPQMRLNAGRVELRGQFARPTEGGNRRLFKIDDPAYIPEQAHAQPMAAWEHGITGRAGYLTVTTGGNGYFQPESGNKWNRGNFGGIWWPAREATARLLPSEEAS